MVGRSAWVHLDFKGGAPTFEALIHTIPYLARFGASGVVVEWEDMFPYVGSLSGIPQKDHYSEHQVITILKKFQEEGLEVIPLVPCFGHLEFVLCKKGHTDLRETCSVCESDPVGFARTLRMCRDGRRPERGEDKDYDKFKYCFSQVCPMHTESIALILELLRQVLTAHRKAEVPVAGIHLGLDEVKHIGSCSRCRVVGDGVRFEDHQKSLFRTHCADVIDGVKHMWDYVCPPKSMRRLMMWHDMLVQWSVTEIAALVALGSGSPEKDLWPGWSETLETDATSPVTIVRQSQDGNASAMDSGSSPGVFSLEVVMWCYEPDVAKKLAGVASKFVAASETPSQLWAASCYKGGDFGTDNIFPPVALHLANHFSWLDFGLSFEGDKAVGQSNVKEYLGAEDVRPSPPRDSTSAVSGGPPFRNFILTGWSRTSFSRPLNCELFPAALPCLLACLRVINLSDSAPPALVTDYSEISTALKVQESLPFNESLARFVALHLPYLSIHNEPFRGYGVFHLCAKFSLASEIAHSDNTNVSDGAVHGSYDEQNDDEQNDDLKVSPAEALVLIDNSALSLERTLLSWLTPSAATEVRLKLEAIQKRLQTMVWVRINDMPLLSDVHIFQSDVVGSGMAGDVLRATVDGEDCVVKRFRKFEYFKREAELLGELRKLFPDSKLFPKVFGHDGRRGIVMERVEGHVMEDMLRRSSHDTDENDEVKGARYDPPTVLTEISHGRASYLYMAGAFYGHVSCLSVAAALCSAAGALHSQHLGHGDLKAKNVIISSTGRVCLLDFDHSGFSEVKIRNDDGKMFVLLMQMFLSETAFQSEEKTESWRPKSRSYPDVYASLAVEGRDTQPITLGAHVDALIDHCYPPVRNILKNIVQEHFHVSWGSISHEFSMLAVRAHPHVKLSEDGPQHRNVDTRDPHPPSSPHHRSAAEAGSHAASKAIHPHPPEALGSALHPPRQNLHSATPAGGESHHHHPTLAPLPSRSRSTSRQTSRGDVPVLRAGVLSDLSIRKNLYGMSPWPAKRSRSILGDDQLLQKALGDLCENGVDTVIVIGPLVDVPDWVREGRTDCYYMGDAESDSPSSYESWYASTVKDYIELKEVLENARIPYVVLPTERDLFSACVEVFGEHCDGSRLHIHSQSAECPDEIPDGVDVNIECFADRLWKWQLSPPTSHQLLGRSIGTSQALMGGASILVPRRIDRERKKFERCVKPTKNEREAHPERHHDKPAKASSRPAFNIHVQGYCVYQPTRTGSSMDDGFHGMNHISNHANGHNSKLSEHGLTSVPTKEAALMSGFTYAEHAELARKIRNGNAKASTADEGNFTVASISGHCPSAPSISVDGVCTFITGRVFSSFPHPYIVVDVPLLPTYTDIVKSRSTTRVHSRTLGVANPVLEDRRTSVYSNPDELGFSMGPVNVSSTLGTAVESSAGHTQSGFKRALASMKQPSMPLPRPLVRRALRPVCFLDRDGVVNTLASFSSGPQDMKLIRGAGAAIAKLRRSGVAVAIITNQSCVGFGYVTEEIVHAVHDKMCALLVAEGGADAQPDCILFSTAASPAHSACHSRYTDSSNAKPSAELILHAASVLSADLPTSYMVGDRLSDLGAALRAGVTPLLVLTGEGRSSSAKLLQIQEKTLDPGIPELVAVAGDIRIVDDIQAVASTIIRYRHGMGSDDERR